MQTLKKELHNQPWADISVTDCVEVKYILSSNAPINRTLPCSSKTHRFTQFWELLSLVLFSHATEQMGVLEKLNVWPKVTEMSSVRQTSAQR